MRTRELGQGGPEVSVVGLGTNNFGMRVDYDATVAVIDAALEHGITLFDTADIYGQGMSEDFIGRALEGAATASFSRRSSESRWTSARTTRAARATTSAGRSKARCGACALT